MNTAPNLDLQSNCRINQKHFLNPKYFFEIPKKTIENIFQPDKLLVLFPRRGNRKCVNLFT